jgi:transcriptional regulator with PAS, ATPase and Fis domain
MRQTWRGTSSAQVGSQRAYAGAIGSSPPWQGVLAAAVRVATTEATVLLQGESGTGKEVIAQLIHQASPRKHGPFLAINCAALPEQLLESELFGYERGAFTGAQQSKAGHVELAARGVLVQLDEGDTVQVSVDNGTIVIRPSRPRYSLDDLVRRITPKNRHDQSDWGGPLGDEVW